MIRRSTILLSAASKRSSLPEVTPSTRRKNGITALLLVGFVGSVYSFSVMKMKQTDDLDGTTPIITTTTPITTTTTVTTIATSSILLLLPLLILQLLLAIIQQEKK